MEDVDITLTVVDKATASLRSIAGTFSSTMKQAESAVETANKAVEKHEKLIRNVKIAGAAALAGLALFARKSIQEFSNAEREQAQLNAVIASTGQAAGVTAEMADKLAASISKLTTFSHGEVVAAEAMLLTFTNIKDNVFPQTTQAVADLATAMGTGLKEASMQVGKALNDPIAGISALTRVGVTFSASQKQVIADLVKTGDVAEAQRIILEELNREFGGSAAAAADTYAGRLLKLQHRFEDMTEQVGRGLSPIIVNLGNAFLNATERMTETTNVSEAVFSMFRSITEGAVALVNAITRVSTSVGVLGATALKYSPTRIVDKIFGFDTAKLDGYNLDNGIASLKKMSEESTRFLDEFVAMNEEASAALRGANREAGTLGKTAPAAYSDMADAAATAGRKVEEVNRKVRDTSQALMEAQVEAARDSLNDRLSLAQAYVKQEKKVEELRAEHLKQMQESGRSEVEGRYNAEAAALERMRTIEAANGSEVASERKRAAMTDFEREVADIEERRLLREQEQGRKIAALQEELDASKQVEEEITRKHAEEVQKRETASMESLKRVTEAQKKAGAESVRINQYAMPGGGVANAPMSVAPVIHVTVNGSMDKEDTARKIREILDRATTLRSVAGAD